MNVGYIKASIPSLALHLFDHSLSRLLNTTSLVGRLFVCLELKYELNSNE